jgi:NAD+ kinase
MKSRIQHVGIIVKPRLSTVAALIQQITDWLVIRQINVVYDSEAANSIGIPELGVNRSEMPDSCDLIVLLGGDGTLLSVARAMGSKSVPILAVNFGSLGFLTEITLEELFSTLESVLANQSTSQRRMMIDVSVIRKGECCASYRALNDGVLTKGALARIIDIDVRIDERYVAAYKADGLIVSTPTGSTAYALSAGGPILFPTLGSMLITPIASHTLTFRSLVVPDTVVIEMSFKATHEPVYLTVDGQVGLPLQSEDRILIRKSVNSIELIESSNKNFFDVLRRKLKWGER